ncbi:GtrA family protein [Erysipelotrichaceae bacterium HCN-30851]
MENKKNIVELITYIIVGGLTTLVNFVVYFACTSASLHYLVANVISWVVAVLFAYFANRKYVFKSETNSQKTEFIQFVSLRAVTLIVESILLFVFVQLLFMNENIAKIVVSVVTVIGNYVFCKFLIFK